MQSFLHRAFIACLSILAGCIAFIPFAEFVPTTTGGTVHTSGCTGSKSVHYNFDGVPMWVALRGSGAEDPPSRLELGITLAEGRVARIPVPEIRIRPLDEGPEESRPLPAWERSVPRRVPKRKYYVPVTVETRPASGPLVGGTPQDGDDVMIRFAAKSFVVSIPLGALPAARYRVQLPSIEIDGKVHTFAPIEYQHQYRVEFMVPVNC